MTEPRSDGAHSVTCCSVEGCSRPPKARQLCEMHYVRQRRTGSPHGTGRPGPAPSQYRKFCRDLFSDWSDRTFSRYFEATQLLGALERETGDDDLRLSATRTATRPNGTINVSRLERIAQGELFRWMIAQDDGATTAERSP